ncbi:GNAT family N-acetyltransferase [Brucella pituitosa]|uniref:GNAT family N-acetyltransferase n=1 Tax=Brucella pituitosa TaxID=571256 RepID=UPI003F4AE79E
MRKLPLETIKVELLPVIGEIRSQVEALELASGQTHLVASNTDSLLEADEDANASPRAIFVAGTLVGFLMYDATSEAGMAQLYRFMIDKSFQGLGYGKAALQAVLAEIRMLNQVRQISICYEPENLAAQQLYAKAGFVEDGLDEDGEMIAYLTLEG